MMRTSIDTFWDPTKILEYDANSIDTLWDPTKYWNTCPRKLKFKFLIENPDPTFIIETRTKGISITPWPSDYNWITNQRYKVWTPQGRIPDKFTVLEEPKEEQSLTFSDFYSIILYYNECVLLIRYDWKIENMKNVLNNKTLNKNWFGLKLAYPK